jgi:hypothetical protein
MTELEGHLAEAVKMHHDLQNVLADLRVGVIKQCALAFVVGGLGLYHGIVATEWVGWLASGLHGVACGLFLYSAAYNGLTLLRATLLEVRMSANIQGVTNFVKLQRAINESATRTDCRCSNGDVHSAAQ